MVLTRIIFAPHEDDEVLSSGGLMQQSLNEGVNVLVVYMTDGRACYEVSNVDFGITPEELAKIRKEEAIKCCDMLEIPISNVQFLDIHDQMLKYPPNYGIALETVKNILKSFSNIEVFIPIGDNPHIDHQATHDIVVQAIKELGKTIPIYQYGLHRSLRGKADLKIKLTPEMVEKKVRAYNCHQSQKFIKVNDIAAQNNEERFKLLKE